MDGTRRGGVWTRSGRGSCEIWSLHLGTLVTAKIVKGVDYPTAWQTTLNATDLGKHDSRDAAMQAAEVSIRNQMGPALGDWIKFQVDPRRPRRR